MQFEGVLTNIGIAISDFGPQSGDGLRELFKADLSTGIFPLSVLVLGQSPFTADEFAQYKRPARRFEPLFQVQLVGAAGFQAAGEVTDHERLLLGKFLSLVGAGDVSHVLLVLVLVLVLLALSSI